MDTHQKQYSLVGKVAGKEGLQHQARFQDESFILKWSHFQLTYSQSTSYLSCKCQKQGGPMYVVNKAENMLNNS